MAKEKVRLWDRLKYKYKLSVINETSYEEVFNFRLSQLHVLTALGRYHFPRTFAGGYGALPERYHPISDQRTGK